MNQNPLEEPAKDATTKNADINQTLSARLEEAAKLVLQDFVKWLQEDPQQSLYHVTVEDDPDRQYTGTQYGYDVHLNLVRNDVHFRIGFECKAYKERAGKVLNSDAYAHNHNLMMILHDKDAQRAEDAVWEAIQQRDREGIYIIGEYGTGKTWLTYKLIETVLRYPDKYPYNPIWGSLRNNKLSEIDQTPIEQMGRRDLLKIRKMIKAKAEDFIASMEQVRDYRKKQLQPLYILDGFDEVMSGLSYTDNKIDFLMQVVTTIQEKHRRDAKKPKIIITSRESDYAVCKNHRKFESASAHFDKIYLIDCEKEEARRCILEFAFLYKEENQKQKAALEKLAWKDSFVQLMTRPVFLSFLRELVLQQYEPKMYLKPFDILEDVVDQTCYNESEETEKQLRELLSKYAIAMSRENKNWYALEDDLKNLLREDAIGIVRLNTVNEQQRISFAHNIIREYLVAQQLFTCQQKEMQPETSREDESSVKSDFYDYIDTLDLSAATQQLLLQNMHRKEGEWSENLDFLLRGIQKTTEKRNNRNAERATRLLSLLLQPRENLIGTEVGKINLHDIQIRDLSIRNCILKHINMQNVHIDKLQIVDSTLEDIDFRDAQIDSIYVGSDEKLKDASYRRKGVNSFYLYSLNQKGRVTEYAIADLDNPKEDSTITIWEEPMETLEKLTTVDENCFPYTANAIYQYHMATKTMNIPYQMGDGHRIYEIGKVPLSSETNYIVYREEERWQIFMYNKTACVLRTLPDELNFALPLMEDGKIGGKITVFAYDRILCQGDGWTYYIDQGKMIPLPEGLPLEKTYAVCQIGGNMIFSYLNDKEFYQILLANDRPVILSIPYTLQSDVINQYGKLQYLTEHDLLAMGENKLYLLRIMDNEHVVQVTALQTQVICRNLILENPDGSHRLGNEEAYRALHG